MKPGTILNQNKPIFEVNENWFVVIVINIHHFFMLLQIFSVEDLFPHLAGVALGTIAWQFCQRRKSWSECWPKPWWNQIPQPQKSQRRWISQKHSSSCQRCWYVVSRLQLNWKMKWVSSLEKLSKARMKTFHLNFLEKSIALFPRKLSWGCLLFCVGYIQFVESNVKTQYSSEVFKSRRACSGGQNSYTMSTGCTVEKTSPAQTWQSIVLPCLLGTAKYSETLQSEIIKVDPGEPLIWWEFTVKKYVLEWDLVSLPLILWLFTLTFLARDIWKQRLSRTVEQVLKL